MSRITICASIPQIPVRSKFKPNIPKGYKPSLRSLCMGFTFLLLSLNCLVLNGANRYYVGKPNGKWSSTSSWSNVSGGSSGFSVPGTSDIAIFDGGGTNNCSIDMIVEVMGIVIDGAYSGTIVLSSGMTLSVLDTGFEQVGGTFDGTGGDILINGPFALTGGLFTSDGILDVGTLPSSAPPADIYMGFEDPVEPFEAPYYRPADPNGTGNGCLETTTWNQYYVRDVCI
ncbi:MAG: hypothetical protein KDC53_12045, partial [Saprospiraceae bacterium]|nr:hypothetical protein [Saprospiraceae bacterium]